MNPEFVGIFIVILVIHLAVGQDPTLQVKLKKVSIKNVPNPYFGEWSAEIVDSGDVFTVQIPVTATFPEETSLKMIADYRGQNVIDYESTLCELVKDEFVGKELLDHGLPADTFPRACPVSPGAFVINKYGIPHDKFPPGTPDGEVDVVVTIGQPGEDPYMIISILCEVSHKIPQLPGLGR